jgi:multicomponent Na+:H+ antiporter subunit F
VVELLFTIAGGLAALAGVLAFFRIVAGPTAADRMVGLDGLTVIAISFLAYLAATNGRIIYLDVALVYGLVSFLGVVALARYLERGL